MNFTKNKHCIVMGQTQKGKTNVVKVILQTALEQGVKQIGLFDSVDRGLSSYAAEEQVVYMETKEQIIDSLDLTEERLQRREIKYLEAVQEGTVHSLSFAPIMLVVDGFVRFQQNLDSVLQDRITKLMKNYSHLGFNLIVAGNNNEFSKGFDALTTEVKQISQAVLLMKKTEQSLFTLPYDRKEADINPGFGYYIKSGKETRIQIPLCVSERKILT
jgi:S-DNA-T family DNA segregation ATPase FtsK/SpoIIIE